MMRRQEAHRRSEMRKHFNPADGLIHNKDGSTQFLNGSPVNGVNQGYVQLSGTDYGTGLDSYDYMFENSIIKDREEKAAKKLAAAKVQKDKEWAKLYNEFDGFVHKDGKIYDKDTHKEMIQPQEYLQLSKQGVEIADLNA